MVDIYDHQNYLLQKDSDLDAAWINFFPLLRRFLFRSDTAQFPYAQPAQWGQTGRQFVRNPPELVLTGVSYGQPNNIQNISAMGQQRPSMQESRGLVLPTPRPMGDQQIRPSF